MALWPLSVEQASRILGSHFMDDLHAVAAGMKCRTCTTAAVLVLMVASGCSSAVTQPWAKFSADRALAAAVADDPFPSAAEVGLAESH
jgi:hypothetical protein